MKKRMFKCSLLLASPILLSANPSDDADKILAQSEVTGGLIVHLGCGNGELLAELGKDKRFLNGRQETRTNEPTLPNGVRWHGSGQRSLIPRIAKWGGHLHQGQITS